ncbi:murein L,D-transpeptidase [Segetibacter sp. 3557_3]|uniref:L,D-transpeptidase family protein n=1 Tax=Segetibacter sp. 3557_3 TaxID=2547429 RepID=UPI001058CA81|nr:L,D-transpeptidase [Segetibacter sp. 3557_3]TDH26229.1 murein L,D-transpeptidase [Segetibacter sp. 3557_3]
MNRIAVLIVMVAVFVVNTSFYANSKGGFYVVIDKSDYELMVYDAEGWLSTYPIVFGNDDLGDKMVQGDRKTPEGTFTITHKKPHAKWNRYMGIDYPNAESIERFNNRKARGIIPMNAKIGGDIGIHGTWPHEDYAIDQYQNWTLGCISLKNEHVEQLYRMLGVGTKVVIKR